MQTTRSRHLVTTVVMWTALGFAPGAAADLPTAGLITEDELPGLFAAWADPPDGARARPLAADLLARILCGEVVGAPRDKVAIADVEIVGDVRLNAALIAADVTLERIRFRERVDFSGARFARALTLRSCEFLGEAAFETTHVDLDLTLDHVQFRRNVSLRQLRCARLLGGDVACDGELRADGIKVDGTFWLSAVACAGAASFGYAHITDEMTFAGATFMAKFSLYGADVRGNLNLTSTPDSPFIVHGPAELGDMRLGLNVYAWEAQFAGSFNGAGMRVGGSCHFNLARFGGPASFSGADIRGDFIADGASFTSSRFESIKDAATFSEMQVGGSCTFNVAGPSGIPTIFSGPASFILAKIGGNFEARGARFADTRHPAELRARSAGGLHHNVDFGSMTVGGFMLLKGATFAGACSLRNATVGNLHLEQVSWNGGDHSVRLDGLDYQNIRAEGAEQEDEFTWVDQRASWARLRDDLLRHRAEYSAQVFEKLEGYFRRVGYSDLADEVFMERKRIERTEVFVPPSLDWMLNWGLWLFVGHGRHPEYALGWSLLIILIGSVVFRSANMQPKPGASARAELGCSPFWYSLDLFVPIIDLKANDAWEPRPSRAIDCYIAIHKLVGAIIVPLGLGAITGLVR
ncbi:MAG: hypothetical protein IAE82_20860 [Opitutaceae bacterium]|nr:hypothetical protein [Opitutaceae bacterium]